MIQPDIGNAIKETLGKNYGRKIMDYLQRRGLVKASGKSYSRIDIYYCVNGTREYEELEVAIIDAVEEYKKLAEKEAARREKLLK